MISKVPADIDLGDCRPEKIQQGYFVDDDKPVRVRHKHNKYYYTYKTDTADPRERIEREHEITKKEFEKYWPLSAGKRIEKTRYHIKYEGLTIELDIFEGTQIGHMMAEVEFKTLEEAERFTAPDWFGADVTSNKRYGNGDIAEHGFPKTV